ncbi:hypothetical protein PUMCH_004602 [Australozyma saopauloensis]|uniref:Uncharacterized protein n=1 Tax=Australozyma saopauloensis TaxID=291208 RepID=A0AAX4HHB6_9ASCO|nr:hypothetical protein PUMCH_004602 [[Candida] saopauloensis]
MNETQTPQTPPHAMPDEEVTLPAESFQATNMDLNPDLDEEDDDEQEPEIEQEQPQNQPQHPFDLWTVPFDEALLQLSSSHPREVPLLSMAQQSKLITFLDDRILQVQRQFIKSQSEAEVSYPLLQLLQDVRSIVDLIWFLVDLNGPLFGQEEYLIRLLGDLEDWIAYYEFPLLDANNPDVLTTYEALFQLFQAFDTRISFLIDGYQLKGSAHGLSGTEIVRLGPIANRLRMEIVEKMERSRTHLLQKRNDGHASSVYYMNVLEIEVGRLLEGIMERV